MVIGPSPNPQALFLGNMSLNLSDNPKSLDAAIDFILSTKRFDESNFSNQ